MDGMMDGWVRAPRVTASLHVFNFHSQTSDAGPSQHAAGSQCSSSQTLLFVLCLATRPMFRCQLQHSFSTNQKPRWSSVTMRSSWTARPPRHKQCHEGWTRVSLSKKVTSLCYFRVLWLIQFPRGKSVVWLEVFLRSRDGTSLERGYRSTTLL